MKPSVVLAADTDIIILQDLYLKMINKRAHIHLKKVILDCVQKWLQCHQSPIYPKLRLHLWIIAVPQLGEKTVMIQKGDINSVRMWWKINSPLDVRVELKFVAFQVIAKKWWMSIGWEWGEVRKRQPAASMACNGAAECCPSPCGLIQWEFELHPASNIGSEPGKRSTHP